MCLSWLKVPPLEDIQTTTQENHVLDISKYIELPHQRKSSGKTIKAMLKWAYIAISNTKRTLLGNYHKINRKYLQDYLDEFVYKLNRRYFGKRLLTD